MLTAASDALTAFDWNQLREWLLVGGGLALILKLFTDVRGQNKTTSSDIISTAQIAQGTFQKDLAARLAIVEERLAAVEDERDGEREARYQLQEQFFAYREGARRHVTDLSHQIWLGNEPGAKPVDPPPGFVL